MVDWFFRVMRKDSDWGYRRYDMRYDPLFKLKVDITSMLPSHPIATLGWDKIERVSGISFDQ